MHNPNIEISSFNSFFEIFAVLNLAYAGSEIFRAAIDDEILRLSKSLSPKIRNDVKTIYSLIVAVGTDVNLSANIQSKIDQIEREFMCKKRDLLIKSRFSERFVRGFKSVFLMSSFYCFAMIIIGGFEKNIEKYFKTDIVLYFFHVIFAFNLILFARSFMKPYYQQRTKPLYVFLIIFLIAISSLVFCNKVPDNGENYLLMSSECNIVLSLIISVSAYLLHFLRVLLHKQYFRSKYRVLYHKTRVELDEISSALNIVSKLKR